MPTPQGMPPYAQNNPFNNMQAAAGQNVAPPGFAENHRAMSAQSFPQNHAPTAAGHPPGELCHKHMRGTCRMPGNCFRAHPSAPMKNCRCCKFYNLSGCTSPDGQCRFPHHPQCREATMSILQHYGVQPEEIIPAPENRPPPMQRPQSQPPMGQWQQQP